MFIYFYFTFKKSNYDYFINPNKVHFFEQFNHDFQLILATAMKLFFFLLNVVMNCVNTIIYVVLVIKLQGHIIYKLYILNTKEICQCCGVRLSW